MSDNTWVIGEFVEAVQLQVVCQTLVNKLSGKTAEITTEHLEAYGNIDTALQVFYENSIREAVKKTKRQGVNEGFVRRWFEQKLITPAETRGLAYRGSTHTEGLLNDAVDVLDRAHIIREERRGGARWYELSHDRFVYPIKDSNKNWLLQYSSAAKTAQWLQERATRWSASGSDEDLLIESELPEAERWLAGPEAAEIGYDPAIPKLVQASRRHLKEQEDHRRLELENAKREARSARRFRKLSYALGAVCIIAVITTALAIVYALYASRLKTKADELTITANAALDKAAESQVIADQATARARIAQGTANRAQAIADRAQELADASKRDAAAKQQIANAALARAASEKRNADARAREVDEARGIDKLYREAFALSRRNDGKQEAINRFLEAIPSYQKNGLREAESSTNVNIGEIYRDIGEDERAEEFFNHAVEVYRSNKPDDLQEANTLNNIALVYINSNRDEENEDDLKAGEEKLRRALAIYRNKHDDFSEAASLINLGDLHVKLGDESDYQMVAGYYSQAIEIYDRLAKDTDEKRRDKAIGTQSDFFLHLGENIDKLAGLLEDIVNRDDDIGMEKLRSAYYDIALEGYQKIKDDKRQALAHMKLAELYETLLPKITENDTRKEYDASTIAHYQSAATASKNAKDAAGEAATHVRLGLYYQLSSEREYDDLERAAREKMAEQSYNTALGIYQTATDRAGQISTYNRIGQFYGSADTNRNIAKAVEQYQHVIELYKQQQNTSGQAATYLEIGRLYHSEDNETEADKALLAALNFYPEKDDPKSRADMYIAFGSIYRDRDETEDFLKAIAYYGKALEIYQKTELHELEAQTYGLQASTYQLLAVASQGDQRKSYYQNEIEKLTKQADIYGTSSRKGLRLKQASIYVTIARRYCSQMKDVATATTFFNKALTIYTEQQSASGMSAVKNELAAPCQSQKQRQAK